MEFNMETCTLRELVEAAKGRLVGNVPAQEELDTIKITGVQTDSRKVQEGDLFIAIVGENNNAHVFIPKAAAAGAAGCLISEEQSEYPDNMFFILVDDTVEAMGRIAAFYRNKFSYPVIAVTGSVGKTTTKDMLAAVLGEKYKVLKTDGNFNNAIGLPITVFRMDSSYELAVLEMGMNHKGEISYLTGIGTPDMAVITNVGDAHIGNLGSRENILRAKCEIFEGLRANGSAILNGDDALLRTQEGQHEFEINWVGEDASCTYRADNIVDTLPDSIRFTAHTPTQTLDLNVPVPGHHMIYPVLTAIAAAEKFGLTGEEIKRGVAGYVPTGMRMSIEHLDGNITIYNDTYNANTQSMIAAVGILSNAGEDGKVRRVAVLGDMLELGEREAELHAQVGTYAGGDGESRVDTLITVGSGSKYMAEAAIAAGVPDVHACDDKEQAKEVLKSYVKPNTAMLFKASRGMRLEELAAYCKELAE